MNVFIHVISPAAYFVEPDSDKRCSILNRKCLLTLTLSLAKGEVYATAMVRQAHHERLLNILITITVTPVSPLLELDVLTLRREQYMAGQRIHKIS